jgi:hypothetical protein
VGERADTVELVLESCVLDAQGLLLQRHLPEHCRAASVGADGVVRAQLVVLMTHPCVLVPLDLHLRIVHHMEERSMPSSGTEAHIRRHMRRRPWIDSHRIVCAGSPNLHLRAAVLEPELDLPAFLIEPLAQLRPLLLIRVRALLEHTTSAICASIVLTLRVPGFAAVCGGGTASSCAGCCCPCPDHRRRRRLGCRSQTGCRSRRPVRGASSCRRRRSRCHWSQSSSDGSRRRAAHLRPCSFSETKSRVSSAHHNTVKSQQQVSCLSTTHPGLFSFNSTLKPNTTWSRSVPFYSENHNNMCRV